MDVLVAAVSVVGAPHRPLHREAGLLVRAPAPGIALVDQQTDAFQAELAEAEVADRAQRIGPVALVPLGRLADRDAELGAAVDLIDAVQAGCSDGLVAGEDADDEVVVGGALAFEHAIEPDGLGRLAHRRVHRQVVEHVCVVEPADEVTDVAPLGGAQVHQLAADDRPAFRYAAHWPEST